MSFSRYCFLFVFSFVLSVVFCFILIPLLKKFHAGQNILSYVKEHEKKRGTPTMGGVAFVLAAAICVLVFLSERDRTLIVALVVGLAYMIVGLLDDFLKKKRKENLGLTAWQKIIFQTTVAVLAAIYAIQNGLTKAYLPFFRITIELGWWLLPVAIFVFLATVNCVNLTDGLDGLAAGSCAPYFLFFGVLLGTENSGLSALSVALSASLFGYLLFNSSPASVFMGDTGSLALGGFAACVGLFSGNFLYIPIVGLVFVLSGLSVIIQVLYFKGTGGKRVFKMTPIHHHFQQSGYSESKIAYAYFALTLLLAVICLAFG